MRVLAVAAAAIVLAVSVLPAADTLPAELTDAAFWKMITDFSEPGGTFDFEMFMSNEVTFQTILPDLLKSTAPGGVYMGVGPEQNFTYISALRPKMAFIVDIRRENMLQMLLYKAMFEMSANRADFVGMLFSRRAPAATVLNAQSSVDRIFDVYTSAKPDSALFAKNLQSLKGWLMKTHGFPLTTRDQQTIDYIYTAFFRGGPNASLTTYGTSYGQLMRLDDGRGRNRNFLALHADYQLVRQMHQKNLIVPVVGDFAGPKAIRAVAKYLQDHSAVVHAFYVSNVEEYITPASMWSAWCRNLAALPLHASGTFVRFGRAGRGSFLGPMPSFVKNCRR